MSRAPDDEDDDLAAPLEPAAGERVERLAAPPESAGMRLDTFIARRQSEFSRTYYQQLIKDGRVLLDGIQPRPAVALLGGESIEIRYPPPEEPWPQPQAIPLKILYEDEHIVVVDKAAGMVVHPAAGNPDGTLVNALLHRYPNLPGINGVRRPGIVHRLDRETSGVMVVARNDGAMLSLSSQIRARTMSRRYLALVVGSLDWAELTVDAAIGRDPVMRIKRAIDGIEARRAVTHLRTIWRTHTMALLECRLDTGRTHQIRIHCSSRGFPIVGDDLYGGHKARVADALRGATQGVRSAFAHLRRPMLHARRLSFRHPVGGELLVFHAPVPEDMVRLVEALWPGREVEGVMCEEQ